MKTIDVVSGIFQSLAPAATGWGFLANFTLCVLFVLAKRWHGALTMDHTECVEKFHTAPTPRISGIPIVLGLIVAWSINPLTLYPALTAQGTLFAKAGTYV